MSHWESMIQKPNEWVERWHVLRPDADYRKVTENTTSSLDNTAALSSSYEALRSSPENASDDELERRPRSSSLSLESKPTIPKPVLVYPGSDEKLSEIGSAATFPRRAESKELLKLDDRELKELTKENTKLNRGDGNSRSSSLTDTTVKKV